MGKVRAYIGPNEYVLIRAEELNSNGKCCDMLRRRKDRMALPVKKQKSARQQYNRDILLSDPATAEAIARALDDITKSLKDEDYAMVLLSLGRNFDQPQIAIRIGEKKWANVEGSCFLDALLQYARQLGE